MPLVLHAWPDEMRPHVERLGRRFIEAGLVQHWHGITEELRRHRQQRRGAGKRTAGYDAAPPSGQQLNDMLVFLVIFGVMHALAAAVFVAELIVGFVTMRLADF